MKQIMCSKTKYCIIMFRIILNIFIRFKWQKLFFNILSLETCVTNCLGRQVFSIFRICSILRDWASTSQDLMHGVYELRLKSLCYRTSVTPYYMAINAYTCFTLKHKTAYFVGEQKMNESKDIAIQLRIAILIIGWTKYGLYTYHFIDGA